MGRKTEGPCKEVERERKGDIRQGRVLKVKVGGGGWCGAIEWAAGLNGGVKMEGGGKQSGRSAAFKAMESIGS